LKKACGSPRSYLQIVPTVPAHGSSEAVFVFGLGKKPAKLRTSVTCRVAIPALVMFFALQPKASFAATRSFKQIAFLENPSAISLKSPAA